MPVPRLKLNIVCLNCLFGLFCSTSSSSPGTEYCLPELPVWPAPPVLGSRPALAPGQTGDPAPGYPANNAVFKTALQNWSHITLLWFKMFCFPEAEKQQACVLLTYAFCYDAFKKNFFI